MSAANGPHLLRLAWNDPGTGEEFEWYGPPPIRIGRAPDNEIVLNAAAISRLHARIERDGEHPESSSTITVAMAPSSVSAGSTARHSPTGRC